MRDDKMYKLLNIYAKNNPLSEHIEVDVYSGGISMKPKPGHSCYYNDAEVLTRMIDGATHFLFWMRRQGYEMRKCL